MEVGSVKLDELKIINPRRTEGQQCIFYKTETCAPNKVKFKICLKCHKCSAITKENFIPQIFNRIIGMAVFLMGTMGMGGNAGGGVGAGTGGGTGGSGGH